MSISAQALTLVQAAVMSNDPMVHRITKSLLENGNILQDIPMIPKATMLANGVRWEGNLPTVNWSKLNVDPVVASGTPKPYQEQAFIIRNAIDADKFIVMDENQITDPRAAQLEAFLTAVTYDVNDKFINNDHVAGNADAIVGLRSRIDNGTTFGVHSDMKIDAGGVDLSDGGMSQANANKFIYQVQKMLDYMGAPDGDGVVIYGNDDMLRRWEMAVRFLGAGAGFDTTRDAFGRSVRLYRNAKLRDMGRKADQTTRIITSTETNTGANGSSTFTSMYAVRYGDARMQGWHYAPLGGEDLGKIGNGGSTFRTLIDYAFGLFPQHTRCVARLYDIKVS